VVFDDTEFTATEIGLIRRLDTPRKVQRWLRALPYNFEKHGETLRTFRMVRRLNTAHCLEAAITAATILEQHGFSPTLLDLESIDGLDHVLFLYRENGWWGTVAKSRDPGLHGRKPVYTSVRQLVRSYFAPYIDRTGRIEGFGVYDLADLRRVDWRLSRRHVRKVERVLIDMPHERIRSSDAEYSRWHARYLAYKKRFPDLRPSYYDNRQEWL